MQGPVDRKIQTLTTHIYSVAKKRFGLEETMVPRDPPKPNRRQTRIENLRRLLNQIRRRFRDSSPSEQLGLSELRNILRSQLTSLRKAKNTRRKTREKGKKRAQFTANPYKFGKTLLDKERSGLIETPVEEVESYLRETHSDPNREDALGNCHRIDPAEPPQKKMILTESTLRELSDIIKKARFGSAPGPNAIPYKVYKMCPRLLMWLWRLLKVVEKGGGARGLERSKADL